MKCDIYFKIIVFSYASYISSTPLPNITEAVIDEDSTQIIPLDVLNASNVQSRGFRKLSISNQNNEAKLGCDSQRKKSLIRKSKGDLQVYVPTCSAINPNIYLPIQCHDISKYCWCVHQNSGEPIPGTSSLDIKPYCQEETVTPLPNRKRKIRCQGKRRIRFLRRLTAAMKTEFIMIGNMSNTKVSRDRAVTWKFSQLDLNRDQILERQEWKPYKTVLLEWKNVKHCTRNLFKICDINFDKKLTKEEWKTCIISDPLKTPAMGQEQINPFLYILKPE